MHTRLNITGSSIKTKSIRKNKRLRVSNDIPISRSVLEIFLMSSYSQERVQFKLIDLRAFSNSHDLVFEISSLEDINTTVATYRTFEMINLRMKKNKYLKMLYFKEKQYYYEGIKYTIIIPFKPITTDDALISTAVTVYQKLFCCK